MTDAQPSIIYTLTDEAPALATHSLLPVIRAFTAAANIKVETRDISLASRILAQFDDLLTADQQYGDVLGELGVLATTPVANIIKLPNISASVPQLKAAIHELQARGFAIPDYPDEPVNTSEHDFKARYDRVKGSAVNPVLREGNSDRRAPAAVKTYVRNNPHAMGSWAKDSASHVSHMRSGDFQSNEQSITMPGDDCLRVELVHADGQTTILKDTVQVLNGEVVDATFMSKAALTEFLRAQIADAKQRGVLFSLHMKATMMKVSDPIIFGHAVREYFSELFVEHGTALEAAGADPDNGFGSIVAAVSNMPAEQQQAINTIVAACLENGPGLAMVNSDKGISNLHVPSDVIVDASMPAMIRSSGKMWNADGQLQDVKAVIPDSSYACIYQETIDYCKENGAFDPTTMGTVPNVGLMAQKAEEYGSHDKTFQIPADGIVHVVDSDNKVLLSHQVEQGDIWRMCTARDAPVQDWVKLAVTRARATGYPAIFWLDANRAHDAELIKKVKTCLHKHDIEGLTIDIMPPVAATRYTLKRLGAGENTISATGNVLRDYLTDLFPILELGTSAKMLSIVPLMNGGGLFETGAGGSAPKHVQQLLSENHLRWDSLGEFLALAVSLEHYADSNGVGRARVLASALDAATARLLQEGKTPSRKVHELDNRGSHFYLAMYWADALSRQSDDAELQRRFASLAADLAAAEKKIVDELNQVQGKPVDIGGYYLPELSKCINVMCPSETFNKLMTAV